MRLLRTIKLFLKDHRFSWVVLILFLFSQVEALSLPATFGGFVIDSETNKPVPFASVTIVERNITLATNENGKFSFENIQEGNYTIKIICIGYKEFLSSVKIEKDKTTNLVFYLVPSAIEVSTVIISDKKHGSKFSDLAELANVLKGKELQQELGLTLAATLKNETGLSIRSMGPAPARPVIRGLGGDRVFISEDGLKASDLSATSPDHAVTIDPFTLERIEVLRGPKVLTRTPITIGGVVNVVKNEIPTQIHDELFGMAGVSGETSNKGIIGAANIEIPFSPFTTRLEFSSRKANEISTPTGVLQNSSSTTNTYSGSAAYFSSTWNAGVSYKDFDLSYGVPGGFVGAHPFGVDISIYRKQVNTRVEVNLGNHFFTNLNITGAGSLYRHKEFEKSGKIGSEFRIRNYQIHAELKQNKLNNFQDGIIGVSGEYRDFDIGGFVFTSPTTSLDLAGYVFESIQFGKFNIESAIRLNYNSIQPKVEKISSIGKITAKTFFTNSLSVSLLYELTNKVSIGGNISKSSRIPTIEELFSEGPHLAAYSYEIGNPDLKSENGIGTEIFVVHKFENLFYNLCAFYNNISNYIIPRNTGKINYATFLPIYQTTGVSAVLYGMEYQLDWKVFNSFNINLSANYTKGFFKDDFTPLPQIPPLKGTIGISYGDQQFKIGINSEYAFNQNNVDQFEEPTAGYMIFNLHGQYSFFTGIQTHIVSVSIDNLFNKEYRNHLSRIKVIMPETGINLRMVYKLFFHL